jgi:plasmid stabilization system protein ParE
MKFTVEFRNEALKDTLGAISWYEKQITGLGDEFFIALTNELRSIQRNPFLYATKYKNVRKAITKRFPYIIYFIVSPANKIIVLAVLHMKRGASVWEKRSK